MWEGRHFCPLVISGSLWLLFVVVTAGHKTEETQEETHTRNWRTLSTSSSNLQPPTSNRGHVPSNFFYIERAKPQNLLETPTSSPRHSRREKHVNFAS